MPVFEFTKEENVFNITRGGGGGGGGAGGGGGNAPAKQY